jgi:hypothetical protein
MPSDTIAPGARVRIRDAEWLVQRVDRTSDGGQVLDVVGLSELAEADDEATRRQVRKRERSLLYVSVMRAKREVIVTAHDTPSPWLPGVEN